MLDPLKALRQSWTEDQEIDITLIEMHKQLGDALTLTKTLTSTKHWGPAVQVSHEFADSNAGINRGASSCMGSHRPPSFGSPGAM